MDHVPIPEDEIASLDNFAECVQGLRILIVNVFTICDSSGDWILVDGGLRFSGGRIRRWAEDNFPGRKPKLILLTHGHFDHIGAVAELAEEWDVPVYAHAFELPYITGGLKYPPPDPTVGGGLMALLSKLYPRGPIDLGERARALPDDGSIPGMPGWRWIHTPGHTDGHISLFREADRVLIAGDAFVTTQQESLLAVATQRPELHGPPAYYTTDWDAARDSVQRLAHLRPSAVATGHGRPIAGPDLAEALNTLATDFDRVARPEQGRYVHQPAA
jgi:glyoxylase-like metal-dependent hydrolase (beta-lactamase superfamily II)